MAYAIRVTRRPWGARLDVAFPRGAQHTSGRHGRRREPVPNDSLRGCTHMDPDWKTRAEALERAGRLQEAEAVVGDAIPDAHFALVIAELYRQRLLRLRAAGDLAGASAAREAAVRWAWFFASQATSGGEGLAYASERDEFLALLPE